MPAREEPPPIPGVDVSPDRPLIGIVFIEDGDEVVRNFRDEFEADAAIDAHGIDDVRSLAGVWADLDWEEAVDALDRIRHGGEPPPPIGAR